MIPYNYATRDLRRALRPKGQQCWQVQKTWSPELLHLVETSIYMSARSLQLRQSIFFGRFDGGEHCLGPSSA